MVTAQIAWELAEVSDGRFRLGLGTQVRAHIERRYGVEFDPPGPRMLDYLLAVRACFAAFRTGELSHHGEYYDLSLLPSMWSPGPIGTPDPPIDLAAVNPWMLRVAGAHADGVHVHPLNTATYLRQTVLANLSDGAAAVGRSVSDLEVIVPAFIVAGDSEDDRARWRELARMQIAFYGSTPNYSFIFDQIDRPGTTAALRDRQRQGDLAGMAQLIDDDMLAEFVVEGPWSSIADAIADRYDGIATRVVNYFGAIAWADESSSLRPWRDITRALAT